MDVALQQRPSPEASRLRAAGSPSDAVARPERTAPARRRTPSSTPDDALGALLTRAVGERAADVGREPPGHALLQRFTQNMVLPALPPQAVPGYMHNNGANVTLTHSGQFTHSFGALAGQACERAGRVEALIGPRDYGQGTPPSAHPLGWDYAAQTPLPTASGAVRAHSGWVRFHVLNAELSGPGHDPLNLLPVLTVYNTGGLWRTFEEHAKTAVGTNNRIIAFEAEVDYHANVVSVPPAPGDNELEKFPRQVEARYHVYTPGRNPPWVLGRHVTLPLPAPSVDPGDFELYLADVGAGTLGDLFNIDPWLVARLTGDGTRQAIRTRRPATLQDLFDLVWDELLWHCNSNKYRNIRATWRTLEAALLRPNGLSLRVYDGWSPVGKQAAVLSGPDERAEAARKAAQAKLDQAAAKRKRESEEEARRKAREANSFEAILKSMGISLEDEEPAKEPPAKKQRVVASNTTNTNVTSSQTQPLAQTTTTSSGGQQQPRPQQTASSSSLYDPRFPTTTNWNSNANPPSRSDNNSSSQPRPQQRPSSSGNGSGPSMDWQGSSSSAGAPQQSSQQHGWGGGSHGRSNFGPYPPSYGQYSPPQYPPYQHQPPQYPPHGYPPPQYPPNRYPPHGQYQGSSFPPYPPYQRDPSWH